VRAQGTRRMMLNTLTAGLPVRFSDAGPERPSMSATDFSPAVGLEVVVGLRQVHPQPVSRRERQWLQLGQQQRGGLGVDG
jgi:hypothetical protein